MVKSQPSQTEVEPKERQQIFCGFCSDSVKLNKGKLKTLQLTFSFRKENHHIFHLKKKTFRRQMTKMNASITSIS